MSTMFQAPLHRLLCVVANLAMRAAASLPPADLLPEREDEVVRALIDHFFVDVHLDGAARTATTRVENSGRSDGLPRTRVVYHIPASGGLYWLTGVPSGAATPSFAAWVSGPPRDPKRPFCLPYDGELTYEVDAAMDTDAHNAAARAVATEIQALTVMVNDELKGFRRQLESDLRSELEVRRTTIATLSGLDVPLRE